MTKFKEALLFGFVAAFVVYFSHVLLLAAFAFVVWDFDLLLYTLKATVFLRLSILIGVLAGTLNYFFYPVKKRDEDV